MRYANYINNKIYLIASIVVLLSAVTYASLQTNSFRRDENKLQDIWLLQKNIPSHTIIKVTESLWNDFTLHSYFMRLSYISLDMDNNEHTYFLCEKNNKVDLNVWNKIPLHSISYDLYAKK